MPCLPQEKWLRAPRETGSPAREAAQELIGLGLRIGPRRKSALERYVTAGPVLTTNNQMVMVVSSQ